MATTELDSEIEKRRTAICSAERTIRDAVKAVYCSEQTTRALDELRLTVTAEKTVLTELEKYRETKRKTPLALIG